MNQINKHQEECLNILQEECAEVIQAASKIKRFGVVGKRVDDTKTNIQHIETEIGDVLALIEMCQECGLGISVENVQKAKMEKFQRLSRYMHTWPDSPRPKDLLAMSHAPPTPGVSTATSVNAVTYTRPSTYAISGAGNSYISGGFMAGHTYTPNVNLGILTDTAGNELVRINLDGSVTWKNGFQVDQAAEALSRSITLAAEQKAGITQKVKLQMRDSVFESIIEVARSRGSLSADDLTYMLEASKIVEKIKGT